MSFSTIFSLTRPPSGIMPKRPLPKGNVSSQTAAGCSYHNCNGCCAKTLSEKPHHHSAKHTILFIEDRYGLFSLFSLYILNSAIDTGDRLPVVFVVASTVKDRKCVVEGRSGVLGRCGVRERKVARTCGL